MVGLTNRHGDEIEEYWYDAFGNIYTGITAPYNTAGYTGHEYDEKSGLINMSARWYNSNNGRFITQDTYQDDIYTPQSLNRYAYVMNNPVNMWDPTGHVPSWVGDSMHYTVISGTTYVDEVYYLQDINTSSSGWRLINKITNLTEIIYKYEATVTKTWEYKHLDFIYTTSTDPETGETVYEYDHSDKETVRYSDIGYHYDEVVKKASEIAQENEEYIRNLAGDPPGDNDPPMFTISTKQVNDGRIELLNPDEIILRNTGKKPTASERLIAGAVQSELNSIFNTQLDVDGWYGGQSAGTVRDLQKELSLPATGVLDVQTFYQLQLAVESGVWYELSVTPVSTGAGIKPLTGNTGPNYTPPSSVWGDYNGNRIPDQYEPYAQGTSYKASSGAGPNYAPSNVPGDYNGNNIPDQYDGYAQGTGNSGAGVSSSDTYTVPSYYPQGTGERRESSDTFKNAVKLSAIIFNLKESKKDYTKSIGVNIAGTPSIWQFTGSLQLSYDSKGDIALQYTKGGGTTLGTPGASLTLFGTETNAPSINNLNGSGYQIGGSYGSGIPPLSAGAEINVIPGDKNYYGSTVSFGIGTPGGEGHVEWGDTKTIFKANILEKILRW